MSTLIRLEHLSAEVRLPDGERLTTVDDVSASFERGRRPIGTFVVLITVARPCGSRRVGLSFLSRGK